MSSLKGRVIEFPRRTAPHRVAAVAPITQERLRLGVELLRQEWEAIRKMREFQLEIERDLAAGATVENGSLTFDRQLRTVMSTGTPTATHVAGRP